MKNLLILRASRDICDIEINQIQAIAAMHNMSVDVHPITESRSLNQLADYHKLWDYIYLATHANPDGFGDPEGYFVSWKKFSEIICPMNILNNNCVFLLSCCRGGIKHVCYDIFASCNKTEYVCGPRWTLTAEDLTAGFHAFIYNMEKRKLQPDQAAQRASAATGYDFLCYDRVEIERDPEYLRHGEWIWIGK